MTLFNYKCLKTLDNWAWLIVFSFIWEVIRAERLGWEAATIEPNKAAMNTLSNIPGLWRVIHDQSEARNEDEDQSEARDETEDQSDIRDEAED